MTDTFYADHLNRMVDGYARFAVEVPSARDAIWERLNELAGGHLVPMEERPDRDINAAFADLYQDLPDRVAARAKEMRNARV